MYTLTKGPSSIAAKTRRGISQNYEKFDTMRDINKKTTENGCEESIISVPKPVFQTSSSRKVSHHMKNGHIDEESMSPQHEELVKYIHESWNMVVAQNPYDAPKTPENKINGTLHPVGVTQQQQQQQQVVLKSQLVNGSSTQSVAVTTIQAQALLNTPASSTLSSSSLSSFTSSSSSSTSPSIYYCDPPSPILSDFKPFDLESWWGRRLFHNITKSL